MTATEVLSERIAVFDSAIDYTERALTDHRMQIALGNLAFDLLERVQTAYLPNVDDHGLISIPRGHMDTDDVAVLPIIRKGGSHFLNPDWLMPSSTSISAMIPQLKALWPEKNYDELHEAVLTLSLKEHGQADYLSTDILPYFSDGEEFGPIAALLQNNVWSLWEDHEISIKTPPLILLGPTSFEGSGYRHASTLGHEFSHVVQDEYLGMSASKLSHELFAYRTCATILNTFAAEIDQETLQDNEFSLEVESVRSRVNPGDNPFAEHDELVQLFAGHLVDDDDLDQYYE